MTTHSFSPDVDDVYYLPVGIRSVEVKGTKFLINNESFYFKGFGKHEDSDVSCTLKIPQRCMCGKHYYIVWCQL